MFLNSIKIERAGFHGGYGKADPTKPLNAVVQVQGPLGKVELNLAPEVGERLVALIADEIAAAGRATAEAMVATVLSGDAVEALPA